MRFFWTIVLFICVSLFVLTFYQVASFAKELSVFEDNRSNFAVLAKQIESMRVNFYKSDSVSNVGNFLQNAQFVKASPGDIKYVTILETSVAAK